MLEVMGSIHFPGWRPEPWDVHPCSPSATVLPFRSEPDRNRLEPLTMTFSSVEALELKVHTRCLKKLAVCSSASDMMRRDENPSLFAVPLPVHILVNIPSICWWVFGASHHQVDERYAGATVGLTTFTLQRLLPSRVGEGVLKYANLHKNPLL